MEAAAVALWYGRVRRAVSDLLARKTKKSPRQHHEGLCHVRYTVGCSEGVWPCEFNGSVGSGAQRRSSAATCIQGLLLALLW
eukprot:2994410-Prymnesium_polylepis.1